MDYAVVYWRCEAKVLDMRMIKDMNELIDWICRQQEIETICVIGVYNKDDKWVEAEKAVDAFKKFDDFN